MAHRGPRPRGVGALVTARRVFSGVARGCPFVPRAGVVWRWSGIAMGMVGAAAACGQTRVRMCSGTTTELEARGRHHRRY